VDDVNRNKDKRDMNADDTSETETEDMDDGIEQSEVKGEVGEIEGGSEHGQGAEEYEDRGGEIGNEVKDIIARAEAKEQRAWAEAREKRDRAEAWEQAYQAGRTRSTATPAKSGGKVQQLAKIPAIGLGHLGSARLPPSKLETKASLLQTGIMATGGLGPDSSSQSIPLDKNAIVRHYVESSPYNKRDRSASPESQQNKSQRISASHSSAITRNPSPSVLPSTKLSTRGPSPVPSGKKAGRDLSPLLDHDPQGSSSTTEGFLRGRAMGGGFRFADAGKLIAYVNTNIL
jgi:hypothetical protein